MGVVPHRRHSDIWPEKAWVGRSLRNKTNATAAVVRILVTLNSLFYCAANETKPLQSAAIETKPLKCALFSISVQHHSRTETLLTDQSIDGVSAERLKVYCTAQPNSKISPCEHE